MLRRHRQLFSLHKSQDIVIGETYKQFSRDCQEKARGLEKLPNRKGKGGSREMHFGRRHDDEFFRFVFPADFFFFGFDEDTSSFSDFTECTDDCTD